MIVISTALAAVTFVVLALFTPVSLGAIYLLMKYRKEFPINGRCVELLAWFWVACFLEGIYVLLSSLFPRANVCGLGVAVTLNLTIIAINALTLRVVRLWVLYFASQERLARTKDMSGGNLQQASWFEDHLQYVSTCYLLKILFWVSAVEIVVMDLIYAAGGDFGSSVLRGVDVQCPSLGAPTIFASICEGFASFLFAATVWKIRHTADNLKLKTEMFYDVVCGSVLALFNACHRYSALHSNSESTRVIFGLIIVCGIMVLYIPMYFYPVWLAKRHKMQTADTPTQHTYTLISKKRRVPIFKPRAIHPPTLMRSSRGTFSSARRRAS